MTEHNQQSALLGKIAAYTELLVNDPRSTVFVSLAETYRKLGLFEDARDIVTKGLELHPEFGPAYVVLARVECQLDHFDVSCTAFERALELDPDSLAALVGYARVKLLLQSPQEARDLLLHARSLSPADPVINKMLLGLPSSTEVITEPSPAADLDESPHKSLTSLASTTLADLYLVQGLTEKALALYRQLLQKNPDDLELRRKIKEIEGREDQESQPEADSPAIDDEQIQHSEIDTEASYEDLPDIESAVEDEAQTEQEFVSEAEAEIPDYDLQSEDFATDVTDQQIEGQNADAAEEDMLAQTEDEEQSSQTEIEDFSPVATPHDDSSTTEYIDPADTTTETIDILNQWLDNIRQRREHV